MRMTVWTEESNTFSNMVLVHWKYSGQHYSKSTLEYLDKASDRITRLRKYAKEHDYGFAIAL